MAPTTIPTSLSLRADHYRYQRGDSITVSLINGSDVAYGSDASCATPTSVWLRSEEGATYFVNSGSLSACALESSVINPGARARVATIDSSMVWIDRSAGEKLYRLPRALPAGKYTVHALTPRGELVTAIELR